MEKKRKILVVNDDGIFAPGLRYLVNVVKKYGDVLVVAPDSARSGQSHAVTLAEPLRLREAGVEDNVRYYSCSGTPADCVKMAVKVLMDGKHPDYVFSGVNHGSNASSNTIYSGTVAGIVEASLDGVPAVAFSLMDHSLNADFEPITDWMDKIAKAAIEKAEQGMKVCWNVNFPKLPKAEIKGLKVCRLGEALWAEDALEREDPSGRKYYWLQGDFVKTDPCDDCDVAYLEKGYISLTPLKTDWTDYDEMRNINL